MIQTDDGQLRVGKSKNRIDHWSAKSGEAIIADQDKSKVQCTLNGEMRTEADNNDDNDASIRENENGIKPEQLDITGSPAKEPEEVIAFASRTATPSERRLRTPQARPSEKTQDRYQLRCVTEKIEHGS